MPMNKESFANLKVGDRLPNGSRVVDISYIKEGAVGVVYDLPQHIQAAKRALQNFAAAVRQDQVEPKPQFPPGFWDVIFD